MKTFMIGVAVVVLLSGCAGTGTEISFTKPGEVAGSGGLKAAKERCANKKGTEEWQSCLAHHDGLYTEDANGNPVRNFTKPDTAPQPSADGSVKTCRQKVTWNTREGKFDYSPCR